MSSTRTQPNRRTVTLRPERSVAGAMHHRSRAPQPTSAFVWLPPPCSTKEAANASGRVVERKGLPPPHPRPRLRGGRGRPLRARAVVGVPPPEHLATASLQPTAKSHTVTTGIATWWARRLLTPC